MLQLILCHLYRSSDAYEVIQVYLFKNFKRDFLESDKSALIWYLHQALLLPTSSLIFIFYGILSDIVC